MFKAGTTRLGKTVFDVAQDNIKDKIAKANYKIAKNRKEYLKSKQISDEIFEKKLTIDKMTIKELKAVCKPLKWREDGPMPNKKNQLINKYNEWNGRPAPEFVMHQEDGMMVATEEERDDDDVSVNSENDIVTILVDTRHATKIFDLICSKMGLDEPQSGMVFQMRVQ